MSVSTLSKPMSIILNMCQKNSVSLRKLSLKTAYETLSVSTPQEFVYHVSLNRPEKLNALNKTMWLEIGKCFNELNEDEDCRVIVLSGAGRLFTAGKVVYRSHGDPSLEYLVEHSKKQTRYKECFPENTSINLHFLNRSDFYDILMGGHSEHPIHTLAYKTSKFLGIDFVNLMELSPIVAAQDDVARRAKIFHSFIVNYQNSITSLEICKKPVLAAVHSACVGAGVDMITAADMRYCTKDAWFQVKEVDIGMAADVGTLQRLPKVIGSDSLARELCYTARKMHADEALSSGLVSRVFENKEKMLEEVLKIAELIAKKSPVAVQGTKTSIVYSRDHSVQEGLNQIALWNQLMLQSEDFAEATMAQLNKEKNIKFSKL